MQRLQSGMDSALSRTDLEEDEKATQFLQLQNRFLTFKQQLNTYTPPPVRNRPEGMSTSQPEVNLPTSTGDATGVAALSTSLNSVSVTPNLNEATVFQEPEREPPTPLIPAILTPPVTAKTPSPMPSALKRKRRRMHYVNYLDDDESTEKRRSRRLKSQSRPYKYAKQEENS